MDNANSYVGRYGNALRKLTALDAQSGAFAAAPQQIGGADTGGFGPSLQVDPKAAPQPGGFSPEPVAQPEAPAPAAGPASAFGGSNASGVLAQTPGIAGPVLSKEGSVSPIAMGGDKPTSWGDLAKDATEDEQEELATQVEKAGGGKMDGFIAKVRKVLGTEDVPKMNRRETAQYIAEIALRAMSKRSAPEYAQNPDGVFADAVLETNSLRKQEAEKRHSESRAGAEIKRRETREDAAAERKRKEALEDDARKRKEALDDDARNHQQALELAKLQAKLLREKGQRTSIQTGDDGTLKLIDLESGEAVTVTEEVEETNTRGSRGKGTTTTTTKVRKPVKAAPKYNAGGLDQDTLVNRVSDAEKALRGDKKLMRELGSKFKNDRVKIEDELRRMAREKVEGDVQSLNTSSSGVTDFNDLK